MPESAIRCAAARQVPAHGDPGLIDVSVCIVNWNCRELLHGCLASLCRQPQGASFEVIVVDNASTDGAAELAATEFPDVTLVRNALNVGFARANNQAAARARGRYLFFLNNDTVVPPFTLGRLLECAAAHPEAGMIGPRLRDATGKVQVSYRAMPTVATFLHRTNLFRWTGLLRRSYRSYRRGDEGPAGPRRVEVLMGAAVLLPARVYRACGGWDEAFAFGGEDLDLCDRIGRRHAIIYLPEVEVIHYGRASTRRNIGPSFVNILCGFARFFRKRGASRGSLLGFKLAVSVNAPLELLVKTCQYLWRRATGRRELARKSLLVARAQWSLLTNGLIRFWRA